MVVNVLHFVPTIRLAIESNRRSIKDSLMPATVARFRLFLGNETTPSNRIAWNSALGQSVARNTVSPSSFRKMDFTCSNEA